MIKPRTVALVAFDDFTDVDLLLAWDLLNRVDLPHWEVRILGAKCAHRSRTGLEIAVGARLEESEAADALLFASGPGTRRCVVSPEFLGALRVDPRRQLIGSQCSGALILAALGLLHGGPATTHPAARSELEALGVEVVDRPLVARGAVATAGGCLSAVYLVAWVLDELAGRGVRDRVLRSAAPSGQEAQLLRQVDRVLVLARAGHDRGPAPGLTRRLGARR